LVKIRTQPEALPFSRRLTGWEQDRFWRKLEEDVLKCGEIMPSASEFCRKFLDLRYNSFEEARRNYRGFRDSICSGEEYQLPEKYSKIPALGNYQFYGESQF
jgi:hypothetical protein